jgi:hypothetical protein
MSKSEAKATMIILFGIRGVIMIERVPEGQMVNEKYYLEVLTKLRERVRKKKLELWKKNNGFCNAQAVKQFLADECIPPNSLDFATCVFYLFPKVKIALKGTHFQSVDEMKLKKNSRFAEQGISR